MDSTGVQIPARGFPEVNQINEIINQNDFLNNNIWNGKAIKADFDNPEKRNLKINKIWQIVCTHLMIKGFKRRKQNIKLDKTELVGLIITFADEK